MCEDDNTSRIESDYSTIPYPDRHRQQPHCLHIKLFQIALPKGTVRIGRRVLGVVGGFTRHQVLILQARIQTRPATGVAGRQGTHQEGHDAHRRHQNARRIRRLGHLRRQRHGLGGVAHGRLASSVQRRPVWWLKVDLGPGP